jgi:hypothetical protein
LECVRAAIDRLDTHLAHQRAHVPTADVQPLLAELILRLSTRLRKLNPERELPEKFPCIVVTESSGGKSQTR